MNRGIMRMAWRNLQRNLRRSFATGSAVAAGFVAFMLAAGYAFRVKQVLASYTIYALHVGHIGIYKHDALDMFGIRPKEFSLDTTEQNLIMNALQRDNAVERSGRYLTGQGLVGNGCKTFPFLATGVDLTIERDIIDHPVLLKWTDHITKKRHGQNIWNFPEELGAIALSEGLAKLLGKAKIHSDFATNKSVLISDCSAPDVRDLFAGDANVQLAAGTWEGTLGAVDGEVVMHYSTGLIETNNSSITMSLSHLQALLNTDHISHFSVWLKDPSAVTTVANRLRSALATSPQPLDIVPWTDERLSPYFTGTMQFIYVMVAFLGCVLAAVVALSIFNSATMTMIERSQEVGMLRSIGYNQRTIREIFAWEGFFLAAIAVIVGALIGILSMILINSLQLSFQPPGVAGGILLYFAPNIWITLTGAIVVSVLAIISTWIAVVGVVRQDISVLLSGATR